MITEACFPAKKDVSAKYSGDPEKTALIDVVWKALQRFGTKASKYFPIVFDYLDRNSDRDQRELLDDALVTLKEFDKMSGVDINKFNFFDELDSFTQDAFLKKNKKSDKQAKETVSDVDPGDSTLLYEDKQVIVYRVNSSAGAHSLAGKDTNWCIARKSGQFYGQYTSINQIFYFAIDKTLPASDPLQKVAIRVMKGIDSNAVNSIYYTSKKNDGDSNDPKGLSYWNKVRSVIEADASKQPPTLLVKVRSGKASQEEIDRLWQLNKSASFEEKEVLNRHVNGVYADKLRAIRETEFDSIPRDWKELDVALIEKLIEQFHDDDFYKKVLELHNPVLDEKVAKNTNNKYILRQIYVNMPDGAIGTGTFLACNRNTPPDILDALSKHDEDYVQMYVAENPSTLETTLWDMIKTDRQLISISKRDDVTPEMLDAIMKSDNEYVKTEIAFNPRTTLERLKELAEDDDENVRQIASDVLSRRS